MAEREQWHETLYDQFGQYFAVDSVLHYEKTDHQDLITFENTTLGRVMMLDGMIQITEYDEFIYHEMMAHVPPLAYGYAKHVLTIGGDGGAVLCGVARHKNVESIMMVEIDAGVASLCRQYLPNYNVGSYDDLRFKLVIGGDINFVNQTSQAFDIIVSNCTDPIGPGENLFISASHKGCKRYLNPDGILVAQDGAYFLQQEEAIDSHRKPSHHSSDVGPYQAAIPTYYGGIITFAWTTDNSALHHLSIEIIQTRFLASGLKHRYYSPTIHTATFVLPQYLRDTLASQPS